MVSMVQAIRAKAESLMGMLEEVDGVPCASGAHRTLAVANASADRVHRLLLLALCLVFAWRACMDANNHLLVNTGNSACSVLSLQTLTACRSGSLCNFLYDSLLWQVDCINAHSMLAYPCCDR